MSSAFGLYYFSDQLFQTITDCHQDSICSSNTWKSCNIQNSADALAKGASDITQKTASLKFNQNEIYRENIEKSLAPTMCKDYKIKTTRIKRSDWEYLDTQTFIVRVNDC